MKVSITTHGGLAAALRRPPVVIDGTSLGEAERAELAALIDAAEAQPASASTRRMPDAQSYVITIEDQTSTRTLRGSDMSGNRDFDALLDWLMARAPTRGA
ncbi:MAG: hypothetical protein KDK91_09405 [Gammaproteobacteria bacterium]|nr:hypothetical protein [Gammaproteobacteria bacterium]